MNALLITIIVAVVAAVLAYAFYPPFRSRVDGWKTGIVAVALAAGGVLQTADIAEIVPPGWEGRSLIIIGVIMAALRVVTTGPIGKK